jgi:5S rRNA maturation endonuclease (ribonuclease M5)
MSKAYIVVEGPTDAAILRKILPSESLQQVKFIDGEGKYSAVSMARKLLMTEQIPTVLVIDADTDQESVIR